MEIKRTLCSICRKEIGRETTNVDDLSYFQDDIEYTVCEGCYDTPEGKLIRAIFGKFG